MCKTREYELDINEMEHYKRIMGKLDVMRSHKKDCDLMITVGEKTIHVNRAIVRAGSDYFDVMFSHDMIEKQNGIVQMKDVEYFAVEKCVNFIYTGKLSVSMEQCDDVLFVANMMQLGEICDKIGLFLQTHVDIKRFFDIRRIARKFSLAPLERFCDQFAISKVIALSKLEEFNSIEDSYLKLLISSNTSATPGMEDAKLAVILQWVNAKPIDRTAALEELLNLINIAKLTPEYCKYLMQEESLCLVSNGLVRMLFSAVTTDVTVPCSKPLEMRYDEEPLANALIVFDDEKEEVMVYFPAEASCNKITDIELSLFDASDFTVCSAGNALFVFSSNRKMFYLEFGDATWMCGPELNQYHGMSLKCAVHGSYVYVGGDNYLEKLNLSDLSEWENVDLKGNVCALTAILGYKKSLYLIGGVISDGNATRAVMRKSPHTKWSPSSSMHVKRKNAKAVVYDENIYVCGGDDSEHGLDHFEIYSNETDVWTIHRYNNVPTTDHFFDLCVANDEIFLILERNIKSYDSNEKSWNDVEYFNQNRMLCLEAISAYLSQRPLYRCK